MPRRVHGDVILVLVVVRSLTTIATTARYLFRTRSRRVQQILTRVPVPSRGRDQRITGSVGRNQSPNIEDRRRLDGPSPQECREQPLDPAPGTAPIRTAVSKQRGDS